ncbi:hypothetical protein Sj15T_29150 [Sphingobium sp. TA15]|nr:hypothetical protein Sj15T_29150 [Sphingobium sp. TA15]
MAQGLETLDQIFRQTDAEAAPAIGTVKNEDVERHGRLPSGVEGSVAPAIDGVQRLAVCQFIELAAWANSRPTGLRDLGGERPFSPSPSGEGLGWGCAFTGMAFLWGAPPRLSPLP